MLNDTIVNAYMIANIKPEYQKQAVKAAIEAYNYVYNKSWFNIRTIPFYASVNEAGVVSLEYKNEELKVVALFSGDGNVSWSVKSSGPAYVPPDDITESCYETEMPWQIKEILCGQSLDTLPEQLKIILRNME